MMVLRTILFLPLRLVGVIVHLMAGLWMARIPFVDRPQAERDEAVKNWSRRLLSILGIKLEFTGQFRPGACLVVSNHVSWLDIVAINVVAPSRFVSKAEVARWPLVGFMVTAAGTLYLKRERPRDAMRVLGLMSQAMQEGYRVAVFPEGTTGDGHGLLHFHANMLQAGIDAKVPIQPIAVRYSDCDHDISPSVAFVGDTTFLQSMWRVLSARGLTVHLCALPSQSAEHADRRALSYSLRDAIAARLHPDSQATSGN